MLRQAISLAKVQYKERNILHTETISTVDPQMLNTDFNKVGRQYAESFVSSSRSMSLKHSDEDIVLLSSSKSMQGCNENSIRDTNRCSETLLQQKSTALSQHN